MDVITTEIKSRSVASLMAWWHDMGVDALVDEAPGPWISRSAAKPTAHPIADEPIAEEPSADEQSAAPGAVVPVNPGPATIARVNAATGTIMPIRAGLPGDLASFRRWLMTDDHIPQAGPAAHRIAPAGTANAVLMVITDMPEPGDRDQLFSGAAGLLFDAMLAAMGTDRTSIYVASLTPGRPATGIIDEASLPELSEIARHHVGLVTPQRLWLIGRAASRSILAINEVEARGSLHKFNHNGGTTTVMASLHLRNLLQHPHRKAAVWEDMQLLMQGMTA